MKSETRTALGFVVGLALFLLSAPVTAYMANFVGPVVFPIWQRDDSSVILAWLILQALAGALIGVAAWLLVKRGHAA